VVLGRLLTRRSDFLFRLDFMLFIGGSLLLFVLVVQSDFLLFLQAHRLVVPRRIVAANGARHRKGASNQHSGGGDTHHLVSPSLPAGSSAGAINLLSRSATSF